MLKLYIKNMNQNCLYMLINVYWRQKRCDNFVFDLFFISIGRMNGRWLAIELSTAITLKINYIYCGSVVCVRHVAALPMEIQFHRTAEYRCFAREHVPLHRVRYRNKCCLYFE